MGDKFLDGKLMVEMAQGGAAAAREEPAAGQKAQKGSRTEGCGGTRCSPQSCTSEKVRSGKKVLLVANIGCPEDAKAAMACDAEGVGLMRSEFLYLGRDNLPTESNQDMVYTMDGGIALNFSVQPDALGIKVYDGGTLIYDGSYENCDMWIWWGDVAGKGYLFQFPI